MWNHNLDPIVKLPIKNEPQEYFTIFFHLLLFLIVKLWTEYKLAYGNYSSIFWNACLLYDYYTVD